jgi:thiol-disulfide isomerase/thioredoxin
MPGGGVTPTRWSTSLADGFTRVRPSTTTVGPSRCPVPPSGHVDYLAVELSSLCVSQRACRPANPASRRHLHRVALVLGLALVLAACGGNGEGGGDGRADGPAGLPGLPAEPFEMSDGSTATLAEFTGQPLVVNFFASWCPPCRAEMPDFEEVHAAVGDEVRFLGFALQDSTGAAQELVEVTGVSFDWALDPDGAIYTGFRGFSMPTTVYISADGEILERDNGAIDISTLRDRIEDLFGVDAS